MSDKVIMDDMLKLEIYNSLSNASQRFKVLLIIKKRLGISGRRQMVVLEALLNELK